MQSSPTASPIQKKTRFLSGIVWMVVFFPLLVGWKKIPYTPEHPIVLSEKWRWNELEALSSYFLYCGTEDKSGKLWFASQNGILSYDGIRVTEFDYPQGYQNTKTFDIHVISHEPERIYVATEKGLLHFREGEWKLIVEYSLNLSNQRRLFQQTSNGSLYTISQQDIIEVIYDDYSIISKEPIYPTCFATDIDENIWLISRRNNEIVCIPTESGILDDFGNWKRFRIPEEKFLHPFLIANDKTRQIWVANGHLDIPPHQFNLEQQAFERIETQGENLGHMAGAMLENNDIIIISKSSSTFQLIRNGEWIGIEIERNQFPWNATFIFQRKNGNLILGGRGEKIVQVQLSREKWLSYDGLHFQCEDLQGHKWFIGIDGSIVTQEGSEELFYTWKDPQLIDTPNNILCSKDGTIWVSGADKDIAAISRFDGKTWHKDVHPEMNSFLSHMSAIETSSGDIWFGSGYEYFSQAGGIVAYRKINQKYEFEYITPPVVPRRISSIAETSDNQFYIGGRTVLSYDLKQSEELDMTDYPTFQWVDHVCSDASNNLWVALWQLGLLKYQNGQWVHFTSPKSIASNQTSYILPDSKRENALWVATLGGISYFDGQNWIPLYLPEEITLVRESGTLKQSSDGSLWVNSALREWYFRRGNQTYTEELRKNFKTIRYTPDTQAPALSLVESKTQYTSPANVYIKWAAMDPWSGTHSDNIDYTWRLNGGDWKPFDHTSEILLLNQKPGEYHVEVIARDLDGNRSEILTVPAIRIIPPLWRRTWFIVVLTITVFSIITLSFLLIRQRIRQLVQFENFKIQFFANMSHELCTPLTVIMGPLQNLLKDDKLEIEKRPIELAYRNARKMLHTIEQILDFRKAEFGKEQKHMFEGDVIHTLKESVELVRLLADSKSLTLIFTSNHDKFVASFDAEKVTKIIDNLVSNSIKYTPKAGTISIHTTINKKSKYEAILELVVEDNGNGIPKAKLKQIFNPFYRARDQKNLSAHGTGLGLAVTKQLVESSDGTIQVESPVSIKKGEKIGTRFSITLPLRTGEEPNKELNSRSILLKSESQASKNVTQRSESLAHHESQLLFVEDDEDIQELIRHELSNYQIEFADDGVEGFEKALTQTPDIIVSDIMIPDLNGYELCKKIRQTPKIQDIPFIAITALKGAENKMTALESGVDAFIQKPFDIDILKSQISALLKSRKLLKAKYSTAISDNGDNHQSMTPDQEFMAKAQNFILSNLENPLFDIQLLANEMNMSRMTLYRKFKALTGDTPSEFVKQIRMKTSAQLLSTGDFNITEVSEKVGMPVPAQFSSNFKRHFQCTPSQYLKKIAKEKDASAGVSSGEE